MPLVSGEFPTNKLYVCLNKLKKRYSQAKVLLGSGAEGLSEWISDQTDWCLCGSSATSIQKINQSKYFFTVLDELDITYPQVSFTHKPDSRAYSWLYKYSNTCGGTGVHREASSRAENSAYWQQEISGEAISALFITDGTDLQCMGINQLHSCALMENYPYVYLGATANKKLDNIFYEKIIAYAGKIINHFNLKGVFSIDMILREQDQDTSLYVLEVNPRLSATYELYERINPHLNLVDEHIRVCEGERLSKLMLREAMSAYRIVYARGDCIVGANVDDWPSWSKDIPEFGRPVLCHEPICSIYADEAEGDLKQLLDEREKSILKHIN